MAYDSDIQGTAKELWDNAPEDPRAQAIIWRLEARLHEAEALLAEMHRRVHGNFCVQPVCFVRAFLEGPK